MHFNYRDHHDKLFKPNSVARVRAHMFTERIIIDRNSLAKMLLILVHFPYLGVQLTRSTFPDFSVGVGVLNSFVCVCVFYFSHTYRLP